MKRAPMVVAKVDTLKKVSVHLKHYRIFSNGKIRFDHHLKSKTYRHNAFEIQYAAMDSLKFEFFPKE